MGKGGGESPRWIRALGKGDGRTDKTFGSHPLEPLSSHGFLIAGGLNHGDNPGVTLIQFIHYFDCRWALFGNRAAGKRQ